MEELRDKYPIISESGIENLCEFRDIKKIENIFRDEVCLLFNLNLSKIIFGYAKPDMMLHQILQQDRLSPQIEETLKLGASRRHLKTVLTKDNDIKEWFSAWMESLIRYRKYTSNEMAKLYNEVTEPHRYLYSPPQSNGVALMVHQVYDMSKVYSEVESVYG